jgi:hypothetical protein
MGIAAAFFLYFAVNMAMVMGLAPVVGVPLPLVSYGGSAMLVLSGGLRAGAVGPCPPPALSGWTSPPALLARPPEPTRKDHDRQTPHRPLRRKDRTLGAIRSAPPHRP